jgi:vitamin B12 transporter
MIAILQALLAVPAMGEDVNELSHSLGLADDESVTTSRFPRPASRIAENVTVVTADDIARINAHTLADVLQTVPGVQLDVMQTPGGFTFFSILGMTSRHILVQIDGVPQNFLSADNLAEIGNIPVQMIERVEIIKGAASAAWGSALGGVVNVITKSPVTDRSSSGMVSGSVGEQTTTDVREELSGTERNFGYYLTGGNIHSDGLVPGTRMNFNHGFGKFTYDLPNSGKATLGLDVRESACGLEDSVVDDFHDRGSVKYLNGYLAVKYLLAEQLTLEVNGRGGRRQTTAQWGAFTTPQLFRDSTAREIFQATTLGLTWGDADTNLSTGIEYEHNDIHNRDLATTAAENNFDLSLNRTSAYLNGTYTIGPLSILPGIRFDHTNLLEDALSYTLGATLRLTDSTILRAYAARGFSMPVINDFAILNGQRQLQNINTVQVGVETAAIPYLWLKGTLFYNNIWKIQSFDQSVNPPTVTLHEQVRQGVDLEGRTSPVYGFALTGGYTYADSWDKQTKAELSSDESGPRHGAKMGLNYDNNDFGLRGALTGNYVVWNIPGGTAKSGPVIWDLHLTQKLFPSKELTPELFFSAHNIFDGSQYQVEFRPNAPRWFEGGVRFRF